MKPDKNPTPLPIGTRVRKISGKPFKSGLKFGTIKGYLDHPTQKIPCYTFYEDDSFVESWRCAVENDTKLRSYLIQRNKGICVATVFENGHFVYPLKHVKVHSPGGFESGYEGSGPADLALSILADYFDEAPRKVKSDTSHAFPLHQEFKRIFIAPRQINEGESYTISSEDLDIFCLGGKL
jgi:hypothetical protein